MAFFVWEDLDVGQARGVVDGDVHELHPRVAAVSAMMRSRPRSSKGPAITDWSNAHASS
jgi:hypothetical protein